MLKELGYSNIITVKEQEDPDGNFPTCPYPNPEIREVMDLGIKCAKDNNADILIASDPDCDRVGVAVKDGDDFSILNGNQVGVLLFNYICEQRTKHYNMPSNPVLVKTIVTTDLADRMEKSNRMNDYIFPFEESDGYYQEHMLEIKTV